MGDYSFKVILSNGVKEVSKDIFITVKNASGNGSSEYSEGTVNAPVISFTEDNKFIIEKTSTSFKNFSGVSILSVDVVFTTESGDFKGVVNENFSKTLSVDVKVNIADKDYKNYAFSMDIPALPKGVKFFGDLVSNDTFTDANEYNYHYELKISGTPETTFDDAVNLKATVKISGDIPILVAYASKDINFKIAEKVIEPEPISINDTVPVLESSVTHISADLGQTQKYLTITINETAGADNFVWTTSGTLPDGLVSSDNGGTFTISGTISQTAETKIYNYTVIASNEFGTGEVAIRFNVYKLVNIQKDENGKVVINVDINSLETGETGITFQSLLDSIGSSELNEATEIAISEGITDLSGIENLQNLKKLDLTEATSLTEIKLDSKSNITEINLVHNPSVKTVDLSDTKVESLDLSNSSVEKLDLAGCSELKSLTCNVDEGTKGSLKELDLTGCEKLETLSCAGNQLLWLDLDSDKFPNLQNVNFGGQRRENVEFNTFINFWEFLWNLWKSALGENIEPYSEEAYKPYDAGKITEVTYISGNGERHNANVDRSRGTVNFSSKPRSFTYKYDTGYGRRKSGYNASLKNVQTADVLDMDVTIGGSGAEENGTNENQISGANTGCNIGVGIAGAFFALLAFAKKDN